MLLVNMQSKFRKQSNVQEILVNIFTNISYNLMIVKLFELNYWFHLFFFYFGLTEN